MHRDPTRPPSDRRLLLEAVVRWVVSAGMAVGLTLVIFIAMTRVIDGDMILDRLLRIFPLEQTVLAAEDPCAVDESQLRSAVVIEGQIGTQRAGGFAPLPGAQILGDDRASEPRRVEVDGDGRFRFATAFPKDGPAPCLDGPPQPAASQRLWVRAPGCTERSVPVTNVWIPHRVLLDCADPTD
jgi:hypothetical protein